jgi:hypothetical protein
MLELPFRGDGATWVGPLSFPRYQVFMMDCKNLVVGKAVYSGDVYRGPASLQKGGHAGSQRRVVMGLDL